MEIAEIEVQISDCIIGSLAWKERRRGGKVTGVEGY